jgi:D-ribose pyranose/furanose isomerase RbsD
MTKSLKGQSGSDWKETLEEHLPLLGHRNWILVVDKAFPAQNSTGIQVIDTGKELLTVLKYTLKQIDRSGHVKPIIFTDKELGFITPELEPEIEKFRESLREVFDGAEVQTVLHETIFKKIDTASKLFKVLVLKTESAIAYSSVFLQLDCKYWTSEKESLLRKAMTE